MQAALTTLKEERRRVAEARVAVMGDDALAARDPAHRRRLLDQMAIEIVEHDQAIALIERTRAEAREATAGRLATPPLKPRALPPVSVGALRAARSVSGCGGRP